MNQTARSDTHLQFPKTQPQPLSSVKKPKSSPPENTQDTQPNPKELGEPAKLSDFLATFPFAFCIPMGRCRYEF